MVSLLQNEMVFLSILVLRTKNVLKKLIFLHGFGTWMPFLVWWKPHHTCDGMWQIYSSWSYWGCYLSYSKGGDLAYPDIWLLSILFFNDNQLKNIQHQWAANSNWLEANSSPLWGGKMCTTFVFRPLYLGVTVLFAFARRKKCSYKNNISGPAQLGTASVNLWWKWPELSWLDLWLGGWGSTSFSTVGLRGTCVPVGGDDKTNGDVDGLFLVLCSCLWP